MSCGQTEGSLTRTRHGKPVKNMTAHVSRLADDLGKVVLREQGAEFLDIRVGLNIKVEIELPDVLYLAVSHSSENDSKSCRIIFLS